MRCVYPILLGVSLPVLANPLLVHPQRGNDLTGNGSTTRPFRTVSQALAIAQPGTTILLQPGTYSVNSGERFPWIVGPGIILQGNPSQQGQGVVVIGGGTFRSQFLFNPNVTIVARDQSEIRGLTIGNPHPRGFGLWQEAGTAIIANNTFTGSKQDGILVTGNSNPTIISNRFFRNGSSHITIEGDARPVIQQNVLNQGKFGITIRQQATPQLIGNQITNNDNGIMVQGSARPTLRRNTVTNNRQTGIIALNDSNPDLGTASNAGQNIFRSNGRDIHNNSSQTINALGNQFDRADLFGKVTVDTAVAAAPRTITPEAIPNSVVVKISGTASPPVGINSAIDPSLPPVTMYPPPEGRIVDDLTPKPAPRPTLTLRFRVVVPVNSETEKNSLRQLLPGSFPLYRSGQEVIQVGAFNSIELAREQVQKLASQGINAVVEPFDR